jgi:hypothetical protein
MGIGLRPRELFSTSSVVTAERQDFVRGCCAGHLSDPPRHTRDSKFKAILSSELWG